MSENTIEQFCPTNPSDWREWLKINHKDKDAVWLIVYKKGSKNPNLTWSEAVDEALCFGWIDSVRRAIDNEKFMQYFGKRKANSTWSKVNKDKVKLLMATNAMTEEGLRCIEVAKQNGSWTILDAVENLIVPKELELALNQKPEANTYFQSLSKSVRKSLLQWIIMAKRPETKQKRIQEIVELASQNQRPKQF